MVSKIKMRIFSDRPVDINVFWIIVVGLLVLSLIFVIYKYSEKETQVVCEPTECPTCPTCSLDCDTCPEKIKEVPVTVKKYVCPDERVVDSEDDCFETELLPFTPITTNEDGTAITSLEVKPACIAGVNGGGVYIEVGTLPSEVKFEIKESGGVYKEVSNFPGLYKHSKYFTICSAIDTGCQAMVDASFYLEKSKVYLFRAVFDQTEIYGKLEYSNEHIIDTRSTSDYLLKRCRG